MKKIISLFLSFVMLLSVTAELDLTVFASTYSGTCGANLTWSLDVSTGEVVISGTGTMKNYGINNAPWYTCGSSYGQKVKSVYISKGVTAIGNCAFYKCYNLTSVNIANTVTSIGNSAFHSCIDLTSIVIPDSVKTIGSSIFDCCNNLSNITMGKGIKNIGGWAFNNCTALSKVNYTGSSDDWAEISFQSYESNPIYYCNDLYINNKLQKDIIISDDVKSISAFAFANCKSLKSVTVGDGVKVIGESAFENCPNLKTVTLGTAVKTIGESAFSSCTNLKKVTMYNNVTAIEFLAFDGCVNLAHIYYYGSESEWGNITLGLCNDYLLEAKIHIYGTSIKSLSSSNKKEIKLTWKKVSGVTGYQVQYATNKKFTKNKKTVTVKGASKTSKTVKKLKSKKTYYVRVRTYKTVNGKKVYSNWSTVKKVKTK